MRVLGIVLLGMIPLAVVVADQLKPFTTDGCSVFPDGDLEDNTKWMECCMRHDFAYWKGGTFDDRERADEGLKQCVSDLGEENLSIVMHLGVRLGGSPFYPTGYRWGYGWPYLRGYEPLSSDERQQVVDRLGDVQALLAEFVVQMQSRPGPER
ncbi:MAG: FAD-binding oxidoreductase [Gammaproteobacteria bacterium]